MESLNQQATGLFSSYASAEFCTGVSYPLDASNSSPLLSLGKIAILAFSDANLVDLAAKLVFNIAVNLHIPLSQEASSFFALEDGEIWAMELFSTVINILIESENPDLGKIQTLADLMFLVITLTEVVVLADLRLALTPSNSIITALTESVELKTSLSDKLGPLDFSVKSVEFLKLSISYFEHQL